MMPQDIEELRIFLGEIKTAIVAGNRDLAEKKCLEAETYIKLLNGAIA